MESKKGKKRIKTMNATVLIMMALAGILTIIAFMKDPRLPVEGLKDGWKLFWGIFPALVFAFVSAGMIGKVLPRDLMTRLLMEKLRRQQTH